MSNANSRAGTALPSAADLDYFLEVSRTLNISRASERLGITQPTLSLAIQRLEGSVGAPLLIRGKSGVRLTRAGSRFATQARGLKAEWERIRAEALGEETEVRGRFTLGCHPSVGIYALPEILPRLTEEHAGIEIVLAHDISRRITEAVVSYQLDFGIVVNPIAHPDLVIVELARDEVGLWRSRRASAAHSTTLICDPELAQTQTLLKRVRKSGRIGARMLASSNLEVIASLAAAGAGMAILPGRVASRFAGLERVEAASFRFEDRLCLVYRADAQKSVAARKVAQAIRRFK